jgi:hypothetical protein
MSDKYIASVDFDGMLEFLKHSKENYSTGKEPDGTDYIIHDNYKYLRIAK